MRLACVLLAAMTVPAEAQDRAATYGKASLQCYVASGAAACLGRTSEACMSREADGETTAGMAACLAAETEVWAGQMSSEARALTDQLAEMDAADGGDRRAAFAAAQAAWARFRDAECGWEYAQWGAGTIRTVAAADCLMRMTAERTDVLRRAGEAME